jgi:glucokinase
MREVIGIDVGATKTAAARVDVTDGSVTKQRVWQTQPGRGGAAVLGDCIRAADDLACTADLSVGIGICELVDRNGEIQSAENIDWHDVDLARAFDPRRVLLESDVRAAARAEATFGAGRDVNELLYLSVGSGISYCLVERREPRVGAHGAAIIVGAPPVEQFAGGLAIAAAAGVTSAEEAFARPQHRNVIERAADDLGRALAALINALDPTLVVVGGGLGLVDSYRERFAHVALALLRAPAHEQPEIVPAALGASAGVVGAALSSSVRDHMLASSHDA